MTPVRKSRLTEAICFLLILLFVYAAASKLIDHQKFVVQIGQSPMLTRFALWISILLPTSEIIVAILLCFSRVKLFALYLSFGLMVVFSAYIVTILRFSEHIPCSCGGILDKMNWNQHLAFNIGFLLLTTLGVFLHSSQ